MYPTKYARTSSTKATHEFISEGKEIAVTLLQNYDLITKRIGNSFEEQGGRIRESFEKLHQEIYARIQAQLNNSG